MEFCLKPYSNMFQRQLKDLHDIYIEAIQLVNKEIKIIKIDINN